MACTVIGLGIVPRQNYNSLLCPLMDSIKYCNGVQVEITIAGLSGFIALMVRTDVLPSPIPKLIKNISVFCADDPEITPFSVDEYPEDPTTIITAVKKQSKPAPTGKKGDPSSKEVLIKDCCIFQSGMSKALSRIASDHCTDEDWQNQLPDLYNLLFSIPDSIKSFQDIIQLQALEIALPHLRSEDTKLLANQLLPKLLDWLVTPLPVIRHLAARILVGLAKLELTLIVISMVPRLDQFKSMEAKAGLAEFLSLLVQEMGEGLLGFLPFMALDALSLMTTAGSVHINELAARTFGSIVALMPLETDANSPEGLSTELINLRKEKLNFIRQMTNPGVLQKLEYPVRFNVDLRSYQHEGVRWLWFLNQYHLNGILADDMGLGKTIQSLCVLLMSHHAQLISKEDPSQRMTSLIVCPGSVLMHWRAEILKLLPKDQNWDICTLTCVGDVKTLVTTEEWSKCDLVIISYDVLRRELDRFRSASWHYCILDEGHVIKNTKSQLFNAVTQLKADHRLILSGTPIQNSVVEMWALFAFLMPGYLGTLAEFNQRYSKPILKIRGGGAKETEAEVTAGHAALQGLHKRVLPFILRRHKDLVLSELPPKIIQDYMCDLSAIQLGLYHDALSQTSKQLEVGKPLNPLQLLIYLRKLIDHPVLVETDPNSNSTTAIEDSGKLSALRELLINCGFGGERGSAVVCEHRALIFCQFKSMLSLVESLFQSGKFGDISWLRLDGTIPAAKRQNIVDQFNLDPSIDIMLLTTQVGGLGISLTGADLVIFLDHDWNPTRDLQAMDRAHRIGQTKTVNVYRIITKGTLEEKIMKLQMFKSHIANTVIGEENRSLMTMATSELLDMLQLDEGKSERQKLVKDGESALDLGKLLDESQDDDTDTNESFYELLKS